MKISVLGCGRWGSFLAWYQSEILGNEVVNFGLETEKSYQILKKNRRNKWVKLSDKIELSSDLKYSVEWADIIIVSISSQGLRGFAKDIAKHNIVGKKIVLCMKGIEESTGERLTEVAISGGIDKDNLAVWVGPGHIQDFVRGVPSAMVIDSHNKQLTDELAQKFSSPLIKFYYGRDIIGTEIGAATKNIMGIAAGMLDGLGLKALKGALMARGAREVARLIKGLGGNELSAYGLCHLGDYETTLFSKHSHNLKWGEAFVQGKAFEGGLAEGVKTAAAVAKLAKQHNIAMPITEAIDRIIKTKGDMQAELNKVFEARESIEEF
ncbi:MAG: glycerol-3-phosphate dehydrogenase [Firmicutes bacterium]|nr:glycerol-3-phosphate dehydrogenase [Bacillota bacterium]